MEVSNVRDHVTHATISGNQAINFGISDSPEFFHILSSTLYSDQILAVVRETLCNAWDAHIEAGCANKAVEVTLTDEELIIRDFGKGIAKALIGETYGVYGGSTKKKNLLVTGGFGLGCKAPFAYGDHFEVTSWHDGEKTIYNMSKSSAEVNGRPGIVPIASFPTDETGLQVKIALKDPYDRYKFERLIRRIAANGEMSVLLNGEPIDVLPFSTMQHDFMLTRLKVAETNHRIFLRYGHVIYPVEAHESFSTEFSDIEEFLDDLPNNGGAYRIIFQAKPNSISVTPSREALSMQEHTLKTLTEIFQAFQDLLKDRLQPECFNVLQNAIVETWTKMCPAQLFYADSALPGLRSADFYAESQDVIVEMPRVARAKLVSAYPKSNDFRIKDLLSRTASLVEGKFGNTGLINSYRSELIRLHRRGRFKKDSTWLHRKILGPLARDLKAAKLPVSKLFIYGRQGKRNNFRMQDTYFTQATLYPTKPIEQLLPYTRNIIVLTHSREAVEDRVYQFPIMKHWLGSSTNLICYFVPRTSKPKTDQARAFFQARNVELIDLTVYHPWEKAPAPVIKEVKEKKPPKPKGLPILGSLLNGRGIRMDFLNFPDHERDIKRTENPKLVVKVPRTRETITHLAYFGIEATNSICALWPNDIALAQSVTQYQKYIEAGALDLRAWVHVEVSKEMRTNKRIHQALACDPSRFENLHYKGNLRDVFDLILLNEDLCQEFGLVNTLTETDRHYCAIWEDFHHCYSGHAEEKKTADVLNKIKSDPAAVKLSKLLEERVTYVHMLNVNRMRPHLLSKDSPTSKQVYDSTMKMLLLALKG